MGGLLQTATERCKQIIEVLFSAGSANLITPTGVRTEGADSDILFGKRHGQSADKQKVIQFSVWTGCGQAKNIYCLRNTPSCRKV